MIIYAGRLIRSGYSGFAFWPFIFLRNSSNATPIILNHERIHLRQQLELLVIPFYLFYFTEYLIRRIQYPTWRKAYENISFEREAFSKEGDSSYLRNRKFWAWTSFLACKT
ncbi:MAG: hypothetical protein HKN45_04575 [Flavobacteriales bacterium]|nr:hypothetical protein [Flavobacteriales bacterium]